MDACNKWKVLCLAVLLLEDTEDVYIFGFMIAGHLMNGIGIALVDRKVCKMAASKEASQLLALEKDHCGVVRDEMKELPLIETQSEKLCRNIEARSGEAHWRQEQTADQAVEAHRRM